MNYKELREIIGELKKELGGIIRIQDIYNTLDILKANVAPKGIFA